VKLVRFRIKSEERIGLSVKAGIIDIAKHLKDAPGTVNEVFARWNELRDDLRKLEAEVAADYPSNFVTLLSPIARPGKMMGIGLNYSDHAAESKMDLPKVQLWFAKAATSIGDPYADIHLPKVSEQLDYEAELVVVIGRRCRHVSKANAPSVIFGYMAGNDVSVRDWQLNTSQFSLGKSFDTHGPVGPCIATADSVDPHDLDIRCFVNGEERQQSNTKHLIFDCYDMVEHLSKAMTLEPGDLLFTGTPAGVGFGMDPKQWLKAGDVVQVEIEGIGTIENRVVNEPSDVISL
jgi:2-keto-4-pentenoate hydratase/2-oxohepta-3-ene-1,7-dioic acid hydratase in catechol pathway